VRDVSQSRPGIEWSWDGDGISSVEPESRIVVSWPADWNHLPAITEKQRFVLELRFGIRDGSEWDYEEIAQLMGVSKQTVHRIEARAMKRLRKGLNVEGG
jgi:predicted DNA-binding protein (UPF0251 family)